MTTPRGDTEASRALALGALVRRLRRDRHLTLRQLAERVPMSASNLSRIELGEQGPPPDEVIQRIAAALEADPAELLRAAGRYATGKTFEETVLARLDALGRDLRQVKGDVREVKTSLASDRKIR
jgi:transcriptional regulator with XRE-family HTH domain